MTFHKPVQLWYNADHAKDAATISPVASAAHTQRGMGAKDDRRLQEAQRCFGAARLRARATRDNGILVGALRQARQTRLTGATRREKAHG